MSPVTMIVMIFIFKMVRFVTLLHFLFATAGSAAAASSPSAWTNARTSSISVRTVGAYGRLPAHLSGEQLRPII